METHKMPSIPKFEDVVREVKEHFYFQGLDENDKPIFKETTLPVVSFVGTVKLHGTNASVYYDGKDMWTQSKKNIITPEKDNAGFASFVYSKEGFFKEMMSQLKEWIGADKICVYGEWAGKGIQKGVGINEIDKTFFIFGIKVFFKDEDGEYREDWLHPLVMSAAVGYTSHPEQNVRNIFEFETFTVFCDFDDPKEALKDFEKYTKQVEDQCPVAKAFGVEGIGEGIVLVGMVQKKDGKDYMRKVFKTKGEKHAKTKKPKVKTIVDTELEKKKLKVAEKVTPAWRLEQMYQETFNTLNGGLGNVKGLGDFLKAVNQDILKEELATISEEGLEPKAINKYVSEIAKKWFFEKLKEEM